MATKFYLCPICGNVIVKVEDSGVTPHCCGKEMIRLTPGEVDASKEKHVPVFERLDNCKVKVKVGSEPHPMTPEHHISFIWLETVHGGQLRYLSMDSGLAPEATAEFCTCQDPVVAVYEYCSLHGLWKLEVDESSSGKCCSRTEKWHCK